MFAESGGAWIFRSRDVSGVRGHQREGSSAARCKLVVECESCDRDAVPCEDLGSESDDERCDDAEKENDVPQSCMGVTTLPKTAAEPPMRRMSFSTPARLMTRLPRRWIRMSARILSENARAALRRRCVSVMEDGMAEVEEAGRRARKGAGPSMIGTRTVEQRRCRKGQ